MDALQHPMNTCFAASNRGCFAASNACFLASGACFAAFSGCFAASNACFAACSGVSLANITTMNWNVNLSTSVEDLWHHLLPLQRWFKTAHCSGFLGSMLISSSALSTMHLSMVKNSFMLYFWDHCIIHHGPQQTKNIKSLVQFQHSRFATMHPTHESLGSSNSNCWTPFFDPCHKLFSQQFCLLQGICCLHFIRASPTTDVPANACMPQVAQAVSPLQAARPRFACSH